MKNVKKKIIKARKTIIACVICSILFGTIGVSAASVLYSKDVTYDNSSSGLSSTNLQDALDELYEQAKNGGASVSCDDDGNCTVTCKQGEPTITDSGYMCPTTVTCPSGLSYVATSTGYLCATTASISNIKLGDYVKMKPTLTAYETASSYTGSAVQVINPSELSLWRVIHKNEDGTVDMISEYVSSSVITFSGANGYAKLVGQLNLLASAYENSTYTSGSRYFGYSNQTEFCSNYSSCESDTGYTIDVEYLSTAGVNLATYQVGTTILTNYWIASRYQFSGATGRIYNGRFQCNQCTGDFSWDWLYNNSAYSMSYALRPIVTLKSTVKIVGHGTSDAPYIITTD